MELTQHDKCNFENIFVLLLHLFNIEDIPEESVKILKNQQFIKRNQFCHCSPYELFFWVISEKCMSASPAKAVWVSCDRSWPCSPQTTPTSTR